MNGDDIVAVHVMIDDVLRLMKYPDNKRATMSVAKVLTVAVEVAGCFYNQHERALCVLPRLSISRFNHRLHVLYETLWQVRVGQTLPQGAREGF